MSWLTDGLDDLLDFADAKASSVLDYFNTKNLTEAQIAQARAQEATAAATQNAISAGAFNNTASLSAATLALYAGGAFLAWKFLK